MRYLLPALALVLAGCQGGDLIPSLPEGDITLRLDVHEMVVPTDTVSGEPFLVATPDGAMLSWMERTRGGAAMKLARMDGGAWGRIGTIVEDDSLFVNWADVPSIAVSGERVWAHWLQYNGTGRYAYGVRAAQSDDGGESWSDAVWLHDDNSPAEHGFASLVPIGDELQAVWLDGRNWADGVHEMTVRTRRMAVGLGPERELDARTCECCPTDMAVVGDDDLIVAYRDRSPEEVRDIYVTRRVNRAWQEPKPVAADGWNIAACPVNGPALSVRSDSVALAWFTAANDDPAVKVAFSDDQGASFGVPVRLDVGNPIGRVDVEMLDDGTAIVSWIEASSADAGFDAGIMARRVAPDGRMSDPVTVEPTSSTRASGYPRMVRWGNNLIFAWTATEPDRRVKGARAVIGV
ncbi:MAG: exo-alpha-sialidase [Rhodothermales bacterium]|nr:exo-alpha-sialidase [Rhodothermales bacterium]MBO6780974.1 exo-alpha-sialidase [Rhodothermales bacterium]